MCAAFTTVFTKCADANRPFIESRKHWWHLLWKWQQVPVLLLWILVVGLESPALGSRLGPLKTALKYHSARSSVQSSHSSLCKQGQEHGHAYTSLSVILFLCPVRHLLTHDCLSSITANPPTNTHHHHHCYHPHSSPPLLNCTQTQQDASCNHCWTQFQGQFEDYLLSLVNKKRRTSILWIFIRSLLTGL